MLPKLTIRKRLTIVIGLVCIAAAALSIEALRSKYRTLEQNQALEEVIEVTSELSRLVHELQKERGLSTAFVGTSNPSFRKMLVKQMEETDVQRASFRGFTDKVITEGVSDDIEKALTEILRLESKIDRVRVLTLSESTEDRASNFDFYTKMNAALIDINKLLVRSSSDAKASKKITAYLSLLLVKENRGKERAKTALTVSQKDSSLTDQQERLRLISTQNAHFLMFKKYADPSSIKHFNRAMSSDVSRDFIKKRRFVLKNAPKGNFGSLSEVKWFETATKHINELREVEISLASNLQNYVTEKNKSAVLTLAIVASVFFATIVLAALFFVLSRRISQPFFSVVGAIKELSSGNLDVDIPEVSQDNEIEALAKAVGGFQKTAKERTQIISDLEDAKEKIESTAWLLTGQARLSEKMSGDQSIDDLALSILNHLASYLSADAGAFYVNQNDKILKIAACYAIELDNKYDEVSFGQTLVGQVAVEKKRRVITDVPGEYFKISSSLGEITPRNILLMPIVFNGKLKCVLELAKLTTFTDQEIEFLEVTEKNIAIAINSCEARDQVQTLLQETQEQSEELQVQQEELRTTNEDLHAKTTLLEESEAKLKEQQEELQVTNEELVEKSNNLEDQQRELSIRNEELEKAKDDLNQRAKQLEQSGQYKSEFLANMSHELRTPLNSILILSKLLMENKNGALTEQQLKHATTINSSGSDLLNLINDILDLSKIEAGKIDIVSCSFELGKTVKKTLNTLAPIAAQKGVNLNVEYEVPESLMLETDQQRFEQITKNLLSNAIKFTEKGAVSVRCYKLDENSRNKHDLGLNVDFAIEVKDTGIGIPEEKLGLIFGAFQQADGTTSRNFGGTGLGLSISQQLANLLGGKIFVDSKVNIGSTFTLAIPSQLEAHDSLEKPLEVENVVPLVHSPKSEQMITTSAAIVDSKKVATDGKKRILIVEDNEGQRQSIQSLLARPEYEFSYADSASTAVNLLNEERVDCIILDLGLPDLSGYELLKTISEESSDHKPPIVVYTGRELNQTQTDLLRKHAASIIIKTAASPERLVDETNYFLSQQDERGEAPRQGSTKPKIVESVLRDDSILKGSRVLLVDDDIRNVYSISAILEDEGVEVICASNGVDAIETIQNDDKIDLVLMDVMMPEMDGLEATRQIREKLKKDRLPIIALTAKAMKGDREQCIASGANDYLSKPVDVEKLNSLIGVWLQRK